MARKPAHPKNKSKAKRQTKKHQAKRARASSPLANLWARVLKMVRVPGMGHDVATVHVLAFVGVLGVAIGAGYGGARALFGNDQAPVQHVTEQQAAMPTDHASAILPEPYIANGEPPHSPRAYEEKVAEEIYLSPEPAVDESGAEVASLPPATEYLSGDQPLWLKNALDVAPPHPGPMIAIVIDDMGVDRKRSRHMWEDVPGPLTLSFMAYADDLPKQTGEAKGRGHELMLHMSMEPSRSSIDAGPNVLMTAMSDGELKSLVNWGLGRFEGYIGVNNHMGSRFTEDPRAMRVVLSQVQDRSLLFLDSRTSAKSVGRRVARELGMTFLERNVFLDNDNDVAKVRHQLEQVENLARKQGHAIAIGHPRDATIEVLKTWIPAAIERGLNIVPVSMLLKSQR